MFRYWILTPIPYQMKLHIAKAHPIAISQNSCQLITLLFCVCTLMPRDAKHQFLFRWIYYCHSRKSTGKKTGKTHLCKIWYSTTVVILLRTQWTVSWHSNLHFAFPQRFKRCFAVAKKKDTKSQNVKIYNANILCSK